MKAVLIYIDDWLSSKDVQKMTSDEERALLRFCMAQAKEDDGKLENDPDAIGSLTLLGRSKWLKFQGKFPNLFTVDDEKIWNEKQYRGWQIQQERSTAGKLGAEKRYSKTAVLLDQNTGNQTNKDTVLLGEKLPDHHDKTHGRLKDLKKREEKTPPTPLGDDDDKGFVDWYRAYPNKVGKQDAAKAWGRLKITERERLAETWPEWLIEFSRRETDKVPHPARYIRSRHWDDPPPPRTAPQSHRGSTVEYRDPEPLSAEESKRVREEARREFPDHPDLGGVS